MKLAELDAGGLDAEIKRDKEMEKPLFPVLSSQASQNT